MMNNSYLNGFFMLFFLLFGIEQDGILEWQTYTGMNEIRGILFHNNKIYTGTDGGFFIFDKSKKDFEIINNVNELSFNDIKVMVFNEPGNIWLGLGNGFIDILNTENDEWRTIVIDAKDFSINDLVIKGNEVYFATDFGISHYLIDKNEVKASFRNLGNFARNTSVKKIFISNNEIWAGTDKGIAKSNINYPNLQDPQFWQNFTIIDNLPDNKVNGFIKFNNEIYIATEKGAAYIDSFGTIKIIEGISDRVSDFTIFEDKLFAGALNGVYLLNNQKKFYLWGVGLWDVSVVRFDDDGKLWAGTKSDGLFNFNEETDMWEKQMPSLPAGSYFADIDIENDGSIWAVSGLFGNKGIFSYKENKWENYSINDGISSNNIISVTVDKSNRKWFGTPGFGAFTIEGDEHKITKYDTTGGKLAGSDTPAFVIVDDIGVDDSGNVWLLNKYANNSKALIAVTPDFKWNYFSVSDGLNSVIVSAVAFDKSGRVWIGTSGDSPKGVNVLEHKGTIEDKSDDFWEYFSTADGLESNAINTINVDNLGYVWIGTPLGANYYDGSRFRTLFGLNNDFVNCITIDSFDNKWFGTKGGISVLDKENYKWNHYNTSNSGLVDDNVLSIAINEKSGDMYFGTEKGLSIAKTAFSKPDETISKLLVYPNPFIPDEKPLTIGNLDFESSVKIFSSAGRLVRELTIENSEIVGSRAFWNGTDINGTPVSSGIYILVSYNKEGKIKKSKLALIKK